MVLEEATASTDRFPSARSDESFPASDNDPFAEAPASSTPTNWDQLPKPMIFARALVPYSHARIQQDINETLRLFRTGIGRPLDQAEHDRIVGHVVTGWATATNITGSTVSIALAQCYRRAAEFRFPLVTPGGERFAWFNPDKLGPLTGGRARLGWHAVRAICYYSVAYALAPTPAPRMWAILNMGNDPTLKELQVKLSDARKEQRTANRHGQQPQQPVPSQQPMSGASPRAGGAESNDLTPTVQPRRWGPWGRGRKNQADEDDMSPTAGSGSSPYDTPGSMASSGDSPLDAYTPGAGNASSSGPDWRQDADDASPVSKSSPAQPGESAWDRIRRERMGRAGGAGNESSGWGSNEGGSSRNGGSGW